MSRLAPSKVTQVEVLPMLPPASSFDYVEQNFGTLEDADRGTVLPLPIFNLFFQARNWGYGTLVVENLSLPDTGSKRKKDAVADEVRELESAGKDGIWLKNYKCRGIRRLSFWKGDFAVRDNVNSKSAIARLATLADDQLLGWAILKHDDAEVHEKDEAGDRKWKKKSRWHVFESVFRKNGHFYNWVPYEPEIPVQIGPIRRDRRIPGWLYCQQNGLNKSCAHVALRTVIVGFLGNCDFSFSRINKLAKLSSREAPGEGLSLEQVRRVFKKLQIDCVQERFTGPLLKNEEEREQKKKFIAQLATDGVSNEQKKSLDKLFIPYVAEKLTTTSRLIRLRRAVVAMLDADAAYQSNDKGCLKNWDSDNDKLTGIKKELDKLMGKIVALPEDSGVETRFFLADNRRRYQKLLHCGIEAGCGTLLAFHLDGRKKPHCGHLIPVFGYTFNESAWAPRGEGFYFNVGEETIPDYIPNNSWLSSFLIHDDNFGSNLCLQKQFIPTSHVHYVISLLPKGFKYQGIDAETIACNKVSLCKNEKGEFVLPTMLKVLESYAEKLHQGDVCRNWLERLLRCVSGGNRKALVLRTIPLSGEQYVDHLYGLKDWRGNFEKFHPVDLDANTPEDKKKKILPGLLGKLKKEEHLWMVEISIPEIFSTNRRKIGEILLDGSKTYGENDKRRSEIIDELFVAARFPGNYFLREGKEIIQLPMSNIQSHTELYKAPRKPRFYS